MARRTNRPGGRPPTLSAALRAWVARITPAGWVAIGACALAFFPSPVPGTPEDVVLLQEIRDLLAARQGQL